jgi:hypothetical protein
LLLEETHADIQIGVDVMVSSGAAHPSEASLQLDQTG